MVCELCPPLEKKTKWYFETPYFVVCDCETCKVPLIILKRHDTKLTQEELIDLMWAIKRFSFQSTINMALEGKLDQNRKKIKDHWHCHIR